MLPQRLLALGAPEDMRTSINAPYDAYGHEKVVVNPPMDSQAPLPLQLAKEEVDKPTALDASKLPATVSFRHFVDEQGFW